jgi:hypothetical protein
MTAKTNYKELLMELIRPAKKDKPQQDVLSFEELATLALDGQDNKKTADIFRKYTEAESLLFLRYIREEMSRNNRETILKNLIK